MEAVMDAKYRPARFSNGGGPAAAKKMRPAAAAVLVGDDSVLYRECLKNHAASLGGHAVDGCGEFMPSPAADPCNPASLKCAACGCHRNFHRRLLEAPPSPPLLALPPVLPPTHTVAAPPPPPPPHFVHGGAQYPQRGEETPEHRMPAVAGDDYSDDSEERSDYDDDDDDDRPASPFPAPEVAMPPAPAGYLSATHMLLSLSTSSAPGGSAPAAMASRRPGPTVPAGPSPQPGSSASARKRFRTKFSPEQKQQMQALSERLGWRLQKSDEAVVHERCREIGVGKGVFKVWMHNNKHNFVGGHSARRSASLSNAGTTHPSAAPPAYPTPTPPPTAPAANASAPPVHADFDVNGSAAAADHSTGFQPATASGGSGSPQSA